MTMITRWEPFRELNTLQDRLNRLFQDSYARGADELMTAGSFVPAVDVYEDEHAITLKLEVPGIEQKRHLVVIKKVATTPSAYPRREGVPSRKPLR